MRLALTCLVLLCACKSTKPSAADGPPSTVAVATPASDQPAPSAVASAIAAPSSSTAMPTTDAAAVGSTPKGLTSAQQMALAQQSEAMQMQMLAAVSPTVSGVDTSNGYPPPVDLSGARATGSSSTKGGPATGGDVQLGLTNATLAIPNADRTLASLRPSFRSCYLKGLQSDASMTGKLVVVVRVAPNGEVSSAKVQTNSGLSETVTTCVTNKLKNAMFDAPGGSGSTLTAPLTFVKQ